MKKSLKFLRVLLAVIITLLIVFFCGYYIGSLRSKKTVPAAVPVPVSSSLSPAIDLQLPGEVEKRIVTEEEVKSKLVEIGQLATYSAEYTVSKSVDS